MFLDIGSHCGSLCLLGPNVSFGRDNENADNCCSGKLGKGSLLARHSFCLGPFEVILRTSECSDPSDVLTQEKLRPCSSARMLLLHARIALSLQEGNKDKFGKLDARKRAELLQWLVAEEVSVGPLFKTAVLEQASLNASSSEEFVNIVTPFGCTDAQSFKLQAPKLAEARFSDLQAANLLLDLTVSKKLVPLVKRGQQGADVAIDLSLALAAMAHSKPPTTPLVLGAALDTLKDICTYLVTVSGKGNVERGAGKAVIASLKSSKQGAKALTRMAVAQTAYWTNLETEFTSRDQASLTLGPEVDKAVTKITACEKMSPITFKECVQRVPLWLDSLTMKELTPFFTALRAKTDQWYDADVAPLSRDGPSSADHTSVASAFSECMFYAAELLQKCDAEAGFFKKFGQTATQVVEDAAMQRCKAEVAETLDKYISRDIWQDQSDRRHNLPRFEASWR